MKILIIGGMHGNEPLGPKLVKSLQDRPIRDADILIANPKAVAANTRFAYEDLNRAFPGDPEAASYESRRAAQLMQQCQNYDLILDFHNTLSPNNDCAFIGPNSGKLLLQTASFLGLNRIIIAEYDCINKYLSNCLSVEISLTSPEMSVETWRRRISQLAQAHTLPNESNHIEIFRYLYTMTSQDRDKFSLDQAGLEVFKALPKTLSDRLGQPYPVYPIFLGKNYTSKVYGGLIQKVSKLKY